jgi:hypothetical protein
MPPQKKETKEKVKKLLEANCSFGRVEGFSERKNVLHENHDKQRE